MKTIPRNKRAYSISSRSVSIDIQALNFRAIIRSESNLPFLNVTIYESGANNGGPASIMMRKGS